MGLLSHRHIDALDTVLADESKVKKKITRIFIFKSILLFDPQLDTPGLSFCHHMLVSGTGSSLASSRKHEENQMLCLKSHQLLLDLSKIMQNLSQKPKRPQFQNTFCIQVS